MDYMGLVNFQQFFSFVKVKIVLFLIVLLICTLH